MAYYREVARGQIRGDTTGRLKLIFHRDTRKVLGVHIIGEGASELVHIGQAVMTLGGTVDYFIETVFNYPTLAECYKIAAFNGVVGFIISISRFRLQGRIPAMGKAQDRTRAGRCQARWLAVPIPRREQTR